MWTISAGVKVFQFSDGSQIAWYQLDALNARRVSPAQAIRMYRLWGLAAIAARRL